MNIGDPATRARNKELSKISPYVGYEFVDQPSIGNNKYDIYTPTYDDPVKQIRLTKMRQNMHCLKNPNVFNELNKGLYEYGENNTFVVQNPDSKHFFDKMHGYRLQELPTAIQNHVTEEIERKYKKKSFQAERLNQSDAAKDALPSVKNGRKRYVHRYDPISDNQSYQEPMINIMSTEGPYREDRRQNYLRRKREFSQKVNNSKLIMKPKHLSQSQASLPLVDQALLKESKNVSPARRRKNKDDNQSCGTNPVIRSMIVEADPVFSRPSVNQKQAHFSPSKQFLSSTNIFSKRINKHYDAEARKMDYDSWNTNKNELLEYMRSHKEFQKDESLIDNIKDVKGLTHFARKFPIYAKYNVGPSTYVSNDAHIKITNPGYTRNPQGKPFFS